MRTCAVFPSRINPVRFARQGPVLTPLYLPPYLRRPISATAPSAAPNTSSGVAELFVARE